MGTDLSWLMGGSSNTSPAASWFGSSGTTSVGGLDIMSFGGGIRSIVIPSTTSPITTKPVTVAPTTKPATTLPVTKAVTVAPSTTAPVITTSAPQPPPPPVMTVPPTTPAVTLPQPTVDDTQITAAPAVKSTSSVPGTTEVKVNKGEPSKVEVMLSDLPIPPTKIDKISVVSTGANTVATINNVRIDVCKRTTGNFQQKQNDLPKSDNAPDCGDNPWAKAEKGMSFLSLKMPPYVAPSVPVTIDPQILLRQQTAEVFLANYGLSATNIYLTGQAGGGGGGSSGSSTGTGGAKDKCGNTAGNSDKRILERQYGTEIPVSSIKWIYRTSSIIIDDGSGVSDCSGVDFATQVLLDAQMDVNGCSHLTSINVVDISVNGSAILKSYAPKIGSFNVFYYHCPGGQNLTTTVKKLIDDNTAKYEIKDSNYCEIALIFNNGDSCKPFYGDDFKNMLVKKCEAIALLKVGEINKRKYNRLIVTARPYCGTGRYFNDGDIVVKNTGYKDGIVSFTSQQREYCLSNVYQVMTNDASIKSNNNDILSMFTTTRKCGGSNTGAPTSTVSAESKCKDLGQENPWAYTYVSMFNMRQVGAAPNNTTYIIIDYGATYCSGFDLIKDIKDTLSNTAGVVRKMYVLDVGQGVPEYAALTETDKRIVYKKIIPSDLSKNVIDLVNANSLVFGGSNTVNDVWISFNNDQIARNLYGTQLAACLKDVVNSWMKTKVTLNGTTVRHNRLLMQARPYCYIPTGTTGYKYTVYVEGWTDTPHDEQLIANYQQDVNKLFTSKTYKECGGGTNVKAPPLTNPVAATVPPTISPSLDNNDLTGCEEILNCDGEVEKKGVAGGAQETGDEISMYAPDIEVLLNGPTEQKTVDLSELVPNAESFSITPVSKGSATLTNKQIGYDPGTLTVDDTPTMTYTAINGSKTDTGNITFKLVPQSLTVPDKNVTANCGTVTTNLLDGITNPFGGTLNVTGVNGTGVTQSGSNGIWTGTADSSYTYTVSNGSTATGTGIVNVTYSTQSVTAPNITKILDCCISTTIPIKSVVENPCNIPLSITVGQPTTGRTVYDAITGIATWDPTINNKGCSSTSFSYTVTANGQQVTGIVDIELPDQELAVPAKTIELTCPCTTTSINLLDGLLDACGGSMSVKIDQPNIGSVSLASGTATWRGLMNSGQHAVFNYTVTSGSGKTGTNTVTITCTGAAFSIPDRTVNVCGS